MRNLRTRRFWLRFSAVLIAGVFAVNTVLAIVVYSYGQIDHAAPSDVIIVLGGGTEPDGSASVPTARRVQHAAALYRRGLAPWVLCSGGYVQNRPQSEAHACAQVAQQDGVPASAILLEEVSTSTEENAIETEKVMRAHHLKTALVVSDNFHLFRATVLFQQVGVPVVTSPAQITAGPLEWWWALYDSYREAAALCWDAFKTALDLPFTSTKSRAAP